MGNKAPTYLKDLIGRLSTFSEEPRLAGLVGMLVTMVMDMICTSRKLSFSAGGKSSYQVELYVRDGFRSRKW